MRVLLFIFIPLSIFAQPNPDQYYRDRLQILEEELRVDPFNPVLLWERLEKRTWVLTREYSCEVFYTCHDTIDCGLFHCDEMESHFIFFELNYVRNGDFSLFENGDFLLLRMSYFEVLGYYDAALYDTHSLLDVVASTGFKNRGEYYYDTALWNLFRLEVKRGDYVLARQAIDAILDKSKSMRPEIYYGYSNHWFYKVQLMEYFGQTNEIVPYVRDLCIENFEYYFYEKYYRQDFTSDQPTPEPDPAHESYCQAIRRMGLTYIEHLVEYAKQFEPDRQDTYEAIYKQVLDPNSHGLLHTLSDDSLYTHLLKL